MADRAVKKQTKLVDMLDTRLTTLDTILACNVK